jgi:hypothetical protein
MNSGVQHNSLRQRLAAGIAGLAILVGIAGAGVIVSGVDAQTPTPTPTPAFTPSPTPGGGTPTPVAPATGTGLTSSPADYSVPLILLALVALGGGTALVYATRKSED